MWSGSQSSSGSSFSGGGRRGGGRNSFRGGRGRRGGGREGRGDGGVSGGGGGTNTGGEAALSTLCTFFLRDGSCRFNDQCRFSHSVASIAMCLPAHEQSIKTLAHLPAPDAPRLLSGSIDSTVKVSWSLNA